MLDTKYHWTRIRNFCPEVQALVTTFAYQQEKAFRTVVVIPLSLKLDFSYTYNKYCRSTTTLMVKASRADEYTFLGPRPSAKLRDFFQSESRSEMDRLLDFRVARTTNSKIHEHNHQHFCYYGRAKKHSAIIRRPQADREESCRWSPRRKCLLGLV